MIEMPFSKKYTRIQHRNIMLFIRIANLKLKKKCFFLHFSVFSASGYLYEEGLVPVFPAQVCRDQNKNRSPVLLPASR